MTRILALGVVLQASLVAAAPTVVLDSRVDGGPFTTVEKRVRLGQHVVLRARLVGASEAAGDTVQWFKIEPIAHSLSNTDPTFHWEPIPYRETPIAACTNAHECEADLHSTVLGDRGGLGTMAFRAEITHGGRPVSSPGLEPRYRGGLRADVARVTVRRDDGYLGYLTELFNTPYIWGSAGEDRVHQAERRIGSDCADFVTYGIRRLGHDVPYTSTWQIEKYTRRLATAEAPTDGTYVDARGRPIVAGPGGVRPGDLLLFAGHVAAYVRDEPPLGIVSTSDVMIHTSWAEPTEQPIAETPYAGGPVKFLRWKVLER